MNNLRLHQIQQQKQINGVLSAIRYELEVLQEAYQQTAGGVLEKLPDGQFFTDKVSLTEKYFIVYPNNTGIVGQIDDSDLCKAIVATYNKASLLIDSLRINTRYLNTLDEAKRAYNQMVNERGFWTQRLINCAKQLRRQDKEFKAETANLVQRIDNYLRNHEEGSRKHARPAVVVTD